MKRCSTQNTRTLKLTFEQKYHCLHDYCLCTATLSLFSVFPSIAHFLLLFSPSSILPCALYLHQRCDGASVALSFLWASSSGWAPQGSPYCHYLSLMSHHYGSTLNSYSVQESQRSSTTGKYSYTAEISQK